MDFYVNELNANYSVHQGRSQLLCLLSLFVFLLFLVLLFLLLLLLLLLGLLLFRSFVFVGNCRSLSLLGFGGRFFLNFHLGIQCSVGANIINLGVLQQRRILSIALGIVFLGVHAGGEHQEKRSQARC